MNGTASRFDDPAAGAAAAMTMAGRLSVLANGLDAAASALPGGSSGPKSGSSGLPGGSSGWDGDIGWSGPAAAALARLLAARPELFLAVAEACRAAATALSRHAEALGPAAALRQQSEQAPPELAAELGRRADALADDSARQAAGTLLSLAESAPPRGAGWHRVLDQVDTWRSEIQLGAAESTVALLGSLGQLATRVANPLDRAAPAELQRAGTGLWDAVRNPVELAKSIVDWDTWRTNPARAAGHLVPDLVAAVASGGTAAAAKSATVAEQTRAALRFAAVRDSLRREATGSAAAMSRQALVRRAQSEGRTRLDSCLTRPVPTGDLGWQGPGGLRLTALQNASAEAFHELSAATETSVTAALREAAKAGQGRLAGLDHWLKPADSFKRKLAIAHAKTGGPLPDLLAGAEDAVRYTAVITDKNYVRGVTEIAAALEQRGFHPQVPHNAWHGPRYRGINSTWLDPVTGAAFEVQFHTPASWRTTKATHGMYEEYRMPNVSPQRKAELHELIAAEYRKVPIPGWVQTLTEHSFPPPRPDPVQPPVDYTVHAATTGAAAAQLGVIAARTEDQLGQRGSP
jgi:hypothetical protein